MKAKKSLGQHFLKQSETAKRISNALIDMPDVKAILEVGPGKGILTQHLISRTETLYLVELDRDMIPLLRSQFGAISIFEGDFLKIKLTDLIPGQFHLIGNFPYNISSQILFKLLDHRDQIPQLVGMFQREVAERIASGHGSKKYGILSVLIQAFYQVDFLFTLGPTAFKPPPRVDSAVIRLTKKETPLVPPHHEKAFRSIVKLAFNQRRKMLRNSLKSMLPEAQDDPVWQLRPEQLSIKDFALLTANLISLQGHK